MTNWHVVSLGSKTVDPDEGVDEEGPFTPLLPPDDRLWRHPSEMQVAAGSRGGGPGGYTPPAGSGGFGGEHFGVRRIWAIALVAGVVGALTASGVGMVTGVFEQQTTVVRSVTPQAPQLTLASDSAGSTASTDWTAVDDSLAPSVVAVTVDSPSGPAAGSGVLFLQGSSNSYIVTDSAIVSSGGSISVSYLSGETVTGRLIGSDPLSGIALLSVPARQGPFPARGSVSDLRVANPVLAIGARTASGGSVFAGSVTAEDRDVDVAGGLNMENMIAVSASQIPDSLGGGPLVDSQGRVVGITLALDPANTTDQGLVFAIPVDVADRVAQEMLDGARVDHPWLGVSDAADLSSAVARQLGVSGGAQVGEVLPGSPASRIGLSANDIITALNGIPVTSTGALTQLLAQCVPGKETPISFIHLGLTRSATVVVSDQPSGG